VVSRAEKTGTVPYRSKTRSLGTVPVFSARHAQAGFTLIEVMVALGVLGLGLFVLLEAHYVTVRMCGKLEEKVIAQHLMEQAIARAEVDVAMGDLSGDGDFGKRRPDYAYSYEATPFDAESSPGLFTVNVKLEGPADTREMTIIVCDTGQTW